MLAPSPGPTKPSGGTVLCTGTLRNDTDYRKAPWLLTTTDCIGSRRPRSRPLDLHTGSCDGSTTLGDARYLIEPLHGSETPYDAHDGSGLDSFLERACIAG